MPCVLSCLASSMSAHVMVSRPSRMATISDSFTMSLMMAPVAYGEMTARRSICGRGQVVLDLGQVALERAPATVERAGSRPCRCGRGDRAAAARRRATSGRLVAMMWRIRYFGGSFGLMHRNDRMRRLKKPRGFFRPDISVSSAWRAPMPPPPMPMPPMMMPRFLALRSSAPVRAPAVDDGPDIAVPDASTRAPVVDVVGAVAGLCSARRGRLVPAGVELAAGGRRRRGCRARRPRRRTRPRRRSAAPACAACGTAT